MKKLLRIVVGVLALAFFTTSHAQTTVTLSADADNTLYQSATGALSNGVGDHLFSGRTGSSNGGMRRRALVKFDLSSIPSGATITAVSLRLTANKSNNGTRSIAAHKVSADWGEGTSNASGQEGGGASSATNDATWIHTFFNTGTWTTAGGDFSSTASATTSVSGTGNFTWSGAQMVADVQGWVTAGSGNFGWIMIGDESTTSTAKRFASEQNPSVASRPQLTVIYTLPVTCTTPIASFTFSPNPPAAGDSVFSFDASASTNADSIHWDYGDGSSDTGTAVTHTYSANNGFTVTLTVCSTCSDGSDSCVTTTQAVNVNGIGIEESALASSIELYPNPTNGQFGLNFNSYNGQDMTIRIVNTIGQTMYAESLVNFAGKYNRAIDISTQPKGIYFLQIITENGVINRRIALQ